MTKKERFEYVVEYFSRHNPDAETELHYSTPFQLLVAVILSAQCTDKRVNMVTPALFKAFPAPVDLAAASFDKVYPHIKSISYPNNKTKHLIGMAKMLHEDFGGELPDNIKDLQKLPGVGRKTANVIVSVIFDQPKLAVDTHVFRVSKRIGLASQNAKTPLEVEKQLTRHFPEDKIKVAHHWLILHGRYICTARKPACEKCGLTNVCKYYKKNVSQP